MKNYLLLILLLCAPLKGFAFTLNNSVAAAFEEDEVTINVANVDCSATGTTTSEFLSLIESAVDEYWNRAPTSRLKLRAGTIVSVDASFGTDAICTSTDPCVANTNLSVNNGIIVACNNNTSNFPSGGGVIGVSVPNNINGDRIVGALVLINNSDSTFAVLANNEKKSVLAHEIGHAIGLGHSPVEDSLMHASSSTIRETLGLDDIHGVGYLYPRTQPVGVCGTITFPSDYDPTNLLYMLLLGLGISLAFINIRKKRLMKN